jgi:hypothetical protein
LSNTLPPAGKVIAALKGAGPTDYDAAERAAHVWGHFVFAKGYAGPRCPKRPTLAKFTAATDALISWIGDSAFPERHGVAVLRKHKELILRRYRWRKNDAAPGNPTDDEMAEAHGESVGYLGDFKSWLKRQRAAGLLKLPAEPTAKRPLAPDPPQEYLTNWGEILSALGMKNNTDSRTKVRRLNKSYAGPIVFPGQGSQPRVTKQPLLAWWNNLEEQFNQQQQKQADRRATVQAEHDYGKAGTVLPGIAGSKKKRRRRQGRP